MSLTLHGTNISTSEVTNISHLGFWIFVEGSEHFISFKDYPEFIRATINQIFNVHQLSPTQLHWPDLDIDIEIEALENPDKFTLVWKK